MIETLWNIICNSNVVYVDDEVVRNKNNMISKIPTEILYKPNMVSVKCYDIKTKALYLKKNNGTI